MRKVLISFLLLSSCVSDKEILKEAALTWDMFKKEQPYENLQPSLAVAASKPNMVYRVMNGRYRFKVFYEFEPGKSWVTPYLHHYPDYIQDKLLNHEGGHFKISIIAAKKIKKELGKHPRNRISENLIDSIYWFFHAEAKRMNLTYDADTNHSNDSLGQRKWDSILLRQMRSLWRVKMDSTVLH